MVICLLICSFIYLFLNLLTSVFVCSSNFFGRSLRIRLLTSFFFFNCLHPSLLKCLLTYAVSHFAGLPAFMPVSFVYQFACSLCLLLFVFLLFFFFFFWLGGWGGFGEGLGEGGWGSGINREMQSAWCSKLHFLELPSASDDKRPRWPSG